VSRGGRGATLVGPGGAGKSTIGALLAERLALPFVDLDAWFAARGGDISEYIDPETCVAETVRRLRAPKIETMRPPATVVEDLLLAIGAPSQTS